ncbi:MAG: hypothetical protein A3F54_05240 [Candidatus Kerfeldbacteria bacterium RIFCSPHIGHO2_12_FULL_48_17]|uniref:MobA-like NTP transferase domain-containing protein n=1 Tax=Candidatus Kerfeldbacteria bacterium RIFCSPHIGHO2_12_FULL_48_17 TaxID=1798542 RepID=A0A1G2B4W7_9BACT|nr:MAG: hypothetical protein A3F54_05240 [Candidatus Kerfeldbacteria bacterium RIFCSPHIGHO2_12_FULL_48_17]
MKAVILAAGMGTRLGSLIPKPLSALIGEKTILDFQIEKLARVVGANNIFICVGYKKEIIMEKFPDLVFIYNHAYAHNNTSKSLMMALEKIEEDVIWMNGDVYFEDKVLELLMGKPQSSCLVDTKKTAEEEIKYTTDEAGNIKELSKKVKNAAGEALGINVIRKHELPLFREELKKVENKDYFEKALENLTMVGKIKLKPVDIGGLFCQEIDFPADLASVQKHIKNNG